MTELRKNILVVEDILSIQQMFISELQKHMPDYRVIAVNTLEKAQKAVRENTFSAIITDCGFPVNDNTEREHGNISGLRLISEIRSGKLGEANKDTIIAINSAEMDSSKSDAAKRFGGNTASFKKGAIYPTIRGKNASEYTVENCTGDTVRWLKTELDKQLNSEPITPTIELPKRGFWSKLTGGGPNKASGWLRE